MLNCYLVVMAGGRGTRFWPKSTANRPKQLLSFGREGSPSLLVSTVARFEGLISRDRCLVVTGQSLVKDVAEQLPGIQILAEPEGRNTAPCIYWAAREVAARDPEAVLLVMPSDHHIADLAAFRTTLRQAARRAAERDELITLGITPSRAETGYGYLRLGAVLDDTGCRRVAAFVEKPDLETARGFLASGQYLWNGGMFVFKARVILEAFDTLMPELSRVWHACDGDVARAFPRLPAISIDYGVMEKAEHVVTFPLECGWDDLGSWPSLEGLAGELGLWQDGNVVSGGELLAIDAQGNIVSVPGRVVALLGVNDLIVVESGGVLLVAPKERAQEVRQAEAAYRRREQARGTDQAKESRGEGPGDEPGRFSKALDGESGAAGDGAAGSGR